MLGFLSGFRTDSRNLSSRECSEVSLGQDSRAGEVGSVYVFFEHTGARTAERRSQARRRQVKPR